MDRVEHDAHGLATAREAIGSPVTRWARVVTASALRRRATGALAALARARDVLGAGVRRRRGLRLAPPARPLPHGSGRPPRAGELGHRPVGDRTGSLRWGPVSGGSCNLTSTTAATRTAITVGSLSEYQWKTSLTFPSTGTYCYRPYLAVDRPARREPVAPVRDPGPGGLDPAFSFGVLGDWGQVDANGEQPRPGQPDEPDRRERRAVRRDHGDNSTRRRSRRTMATSCRSAPTPARSSARLLDGARAARCRSSPRSATTA